MAGDRKDWLRVVYGRGFQSEVEGERRAPRTEIAVRQSPPELDLGSAPGREQRARVTVVPSDPTQAWTLWLRDLGPGPTGAGSSHVWWRVEPGTWQPLGESWRQCVAEGRGRVRLDVWLRLRGRPEVVPRLGFVAEPVVGSS